MNELISEFDVYAGLRKRIMVDMSLTAVHHGHVRLLKKAYQLGDVIVALTSDKEIFKSKGFYPMLSFEHRKEILLAFKYVQEVVESAWLIDEKFPAHAARNAVLARPHQHASLRSMSLGISEHSDSAITWCEPCAMRMKT